LAEDTAVLERDTGTPAPETTPPAETQETEAVLAPVAETEASEPTETTPTPPSPWDGLAPDEIEAKVQATLRDQEARLNESARQRQENARRETEDRTRTESYKRNQQEADKARGNYLLGQVAAVIKQAVDSGEDPNWQAVQQVTEAAHHSAIQTANDYWGGVAEDWLTANHPDWRPPRNLTQDFQRARESYDYVNQAKTLFSIVEAAALEKAKATLRPEMEKEIREKLDAERKTAELRDGDKRRAGQVNPTNTGVAGARVPTALADLERKLADQGLSDSEWASYDRARRAAGLS
jgi:hypothetical protein